MTPALVTLVRDLRLRRGRERRGLALAEGIRLVEEALLAGIGMKGALISPGLEATPRGNALKTSLLGAGCRTEMVEARTLDELADTEHPQGVIAVIEPRAWVLDDISVGKGSVVLVLDAVQDPGNVGTIVRTALALGASGVIALKGTADLSNPKVLRGSMGALFRLPSVAATPEELLAWSRAAGVSLLVAAVDGAPVRAWDQGPIALVLGNEGAGVSPAIDAAAAGRIGIPLRPGVESLNVAVAAGILLYEVRRER